MVGMLGTTAANRRRDAAGGAVHNVPLATGTVDGTQSPYDTVAPGDTLLLEAGTRGQLQLRNLVGTAAQPITVVNDGGVVDIVGSGSGMYAALYIRAACKHLRVLGNGVSSQVGAGFSAGQQQAGIICRNADRGISTWAPESVEHIEVGYVEVGPTTGNPGIHTSNHDTRTEASRQRGLWFHHLYVHDIDDSEGFYIGSSTWTSGVANEVDGVVIEHCLIEDTGWDGIQVGSCAYDDNVPGGYARNMLRGNVIRRVGQHVNAGSTHDKGIIINRGTARMDILGNWVEEAGGPGIYDQGTGGGVGGMVVCANNVVIRSGVTTTGQDGILIASGNGTDGDYHVLANTCVDNGGFGVDPGRDVGTGNTIQGNVCVGNGAGGVDTRAGWTPTANRTTGTVADAGFVDADNDDYHLDAGSPCIGAGVDLSAFIDDDFDGVSRPQGGSWDQGAYERVV